MSVLEATEQLVPAGVWTADPSHSTVEFAVRHMMIATVKGQFSDFEARLEGGESPRLAGSIRVASVDTRDESRDAHLRSPEFFDAERYPEARLEAVRLEPGRIVGELALRGVTGEVAFAARFTGVVTDPWGNERLGLDLEGEIDRAEFGLTWNPPAPGGGVLVDGRVKLAASFSFVKQA